MHRNNLNEGLSEHALDFLIKPLLSIDEYESKISDKRAIVIGFFINDEDPAKDLSNFIDRSSLPILDTEVSPAPTPDGYYVVFVELQRDEEFPKNIIEMLKEIDNLTKIEKWEFQCPSHEEPLPVKEDIMKKYLVLSQDAIIDDYNLEKDQKESVKETTEFWKFSLLDSIELNNDRITFIKHNTPYKYRILNETITGGLDFKFESDTRGLQQLLGPAYNVWSIGGKLVVEHQNKSVVLSKI
jgi:hypothetical protein